MTDSDTYDIIDGESSGGFGKNEGLTFNQILMAQLSRTTQNLSEDMIVGHWKTLPIKTGTGAVMMQQVYIPDGRKKAINSIQTFYDLLLPRFDEDMKTRDAETKKKLLEKKKLHREKQTSNANWIEIELKYYRIIFQELNLLMARLGYFTEEGVTL